MSETEQKPAQSPAGGAGGQLPQGPQTPQKNGQPAPEPQEALNQELVRLRAGNRRLKVVSGALGTIFILAAAAGYMAYRKIASVAEPMAGAFQAFQAQPAPLSVSVQQSLPGMPGAQVAQPPGSSSPGTSSLGLFSGGLPGSGTDAPGADPAVAKANAQRAMRALSKYMKRPVVKRFLADLKRDPSVAAALGNKNNANPMALITAVRGSRYLNLLIMKYSADPAFIKTMTDIASDPDIRAISGSLPPGSLPQFSGIPGAAPQAVARPVDVQPASSPQAGGGPEYGGSMTVDQSALGGTSSEPSQESNGVPSPVDSQ